MQNVFSSDFPDARACVEHGFCGRFLEKACDGKACSLERVLSPRVYPGVAPLRYSRALSAACREHLTALDACGASGVEHQQPSTPAPCDGSTTAVRVQRACARGRVGSFGELLAVHAADSKKANAQLPLTQWLCDFDGMRCAHDQRGLSADSRREMLLDPTSPVCCSSTTTTDSNGAAACQAVFDEETGDGACSGAACRGCTSADPTIAFGALGVAHVERKSGEHSWCVEMTTGMCDDDDQQRHDTVDADVVEAIYSGTHLLNYERKGATTFVAAFWPKVTSIRKACRLSLFHAWFVHVAQKKKKKKNRSMTAL